MSINCLAVTLFLIAFIFLEIDSNGRVLDPVHRGGAWRRGFESSVNYDDHMNNCGGFSVQHKKNNGNCGPCGDDFADPQPRKNENGGLYGTGTIVKKYKVGQTVDVKVEISSNKKGYFELSICKLNEPKEIETEPCFEANPLSVNGTSQQYYLDDQKAKLLVVTKVELPKNLTCEHCVLRWHYVTGNNWGACREKSPKSRCRPQETFRTCSDISISV